METVFLKTMPEEESVQINFTDNHKDIYWTVPGEDFVFHNELYDVIQKKIINGKVYYTCIREKREMELLEKIVQNNTVKTANDIGVINPNLFSEFVFTQKKEIQLNVILNTACFPFNNKSLPIRFQDIILPPPRLCCPIV